MALAWVLLGVLLLLAETRHLAFFAVFGAAGAFAAAAVAAFFPDVVALQLVVAVIVASLGIWAVRPRMRSSFQVRFDGRLGRGVHGSLIGEEVTTLDTVSADDVGHVLLAGERWLAVSGSGDAIPARTRVLVTGVDGTTLMVWPVDGVVGAIDPVGSEGVPPAVAPDGPGHEGQGSSDPLGDRGTDLTPRRLQGEQP